ncbi:hypothetical protein EYB26_006645 [Talaromyces marneffei]|uniref:uncharacterized protein n=1 Tax=Talaromyces marneffei TaxID=37727 RepID=UPI0012AA3912|nr:uncharacterized protein EYB26_006645 [Talaromyces marneffei]QGA18960.1 hypothetical protein EYB26_006645 [Talaromyces marneffei]
MPPISGQTLLVIGGSSGIGFGVATLALAEGMRVAIASSNPERVANAIERLKKSSSNATSIVLGYTVDLGQKDVESRIGKLLTDVTTACFCIMVPNYLINSSSPLGTQSSTDQRAK